jgi:RNA polymerase sigma factor (sigma-70 family)
LRQISRLLEDGTVTGLSDGRLLERFVSAHDAAAFEALVARHGPMVLSVCRGVLKDPNNAEDAFQATFLILVKKSGTFGGHVALGPWLYQVAYRVAIRANSAAVRRRACERQAGQMAAATSTSGPLAPPDEPLQALHEEIARLPEKFRRVVVLCDLERVPQDRAAGELRLSERTLQRRLSEGRKRLKARLIRRGLAPEGRMLAAIFLREARAAVPAAWGEATVQAALATVNQGMTVGAISAASTELTHEVLRIMLIQKLTSGVATLLAAGLIACGAAAAMVTLSDKQSKQTAASSDLPLRRDAGITVLQLDPKSSDSPGKVIVRGRVLGPDGRPVPGAKLYLTVMKGYFRERFDAAELATTGLDGQFEFTVAKARIGDEKIVVAAMAANHGVGWLEVPAGGKRDDLTLRLVSDDVPINGRIVDLQGKPVPGVTLRVLEISAAPGEDPGPWLDSTPTQGKTWKGRGPKKQDFYWNCINLSQLAMKVTTDAAGRFQLTGIGRNRRVRAQLDGPVIASQYVHVLTRPGRTIEVTEYEGQPRAVSYYGADFLYVAAPTKPVVGVVRDRDTRKPLPGVTVESNMLANDPIPGNAIVQTETDGEGRYRLTGMPKGTGNKVRIVPREDQPYVSVHALVPDSPGLGPVTVDFELKRGVSIEGKLTEKATGRPVQGSVDYFALADNPNIVDHPGFDGTISPFWGVATKQDGSFRVVGLPGPGLIAVFYTDQHLLAPDRDDEYGIKEPVLYTSPRQLGLLINYTAIARIDPAKGVESVKRDVTVDPGWVFSGTVFGPDGKPLVGALSTGLTDRDGPHEAMKAAEFVVRAFNPRRPREVFFQHPGKGLVGIARPPQQNGGSVAVHMQPGATIVGRLVHEDGAPRADVELELRHRNKANSFYRRWSD